MATKHSRAPRKTERSTRKPRPQALPKRPAEPFRPLSANRTEVDRALPPTPVVAAALNRALSTRRRVDQADLADFYDDVLADLAVDPSDTLYPHVVARLHTIACTHCPRFRWRHAKPPGSSGWVWTRPTTGAAAEEPEDEDDDV